MLTALATAPVTGTITAAVVTGPHWGPGPWWFIFPLLWFLLFASVIFLIARRARRGWGPGGSGPWRHAGPDPVAILGERYARGEIDESEYRARLTVLREPRPPQS
ncbi:SHOCT domain-containing protein [Cellulosimicrobium arenosum]|uniref:SHOCT domain-containing protein n=1 Tax=Cellulosimicrobium arenosum TaxID=2708133 RepID=A0A927J0F5_9MICO|nr:SHOCT domain-containing protein [Cellulosimicrobium arenosum]MBD8079599.1 SHOCT domain-containing protein [Cellulosimicrobium arenosum]